MRTAHRAQFLGEVVLNEDESVYNIFTIYIIYILYI